MKRELILGYMLASTLHEIWRKKNKDKKERFEIAGNDLDGNKITNISDEVRHRIRKDGTLEIDIINTNFDNLTPDWRQENIYAGVFIVKFCEKNNLNLDALELFVPRQSRSKEAQLIINMVGNFIHNAWLNRPSNRWDKLSQDEEEKLKNNDLEAWNKYQFKPFCELNDENQELDIDQLRVYQLLIKEYGSKDQIIEYAPEINEEIKKQLLLADKMYEIVPTIKII